MAIFAELLTLARLKDNYELDATGGTALWPADTTYVATVPAGKRWWLFGGGFFMDVSSTSSVRVFNAADEIVLLLHAAGAATGAQAYPATTGAAGNMGSGSGPFPMDAGGYVQITFGTAQTTGAYASCLVLEIDVE